MIYFHINIYLSYFLHLQDTLKAISFVLKYQITKLCLFRFNSMLKPHQEGVVLDLCKAHPFAVIDLSVYWSFILSFWVFDEIWN